MPSAVLEALLLYLAATLQNALFVLFSTLILSAVGGRAKAAQAGVGPKIRFRIRGIDVAIAPIPLSTWVQIAGRSPTDTYDGPDSWRSLSLPRRLMALLGPWALLSVVAILCIGPTHALRSFEHALPELVLTLDTTPLVRAFLRILREERFTTSLGIILTKLVALNLLPLPVLAGGSALQEAWSDLTPNATPTPRTIVWSVISTLFIFSIAARLTWGTIHAMF
jgi:hypothetical protein